MLGLPASPERLALAMASRHKDILVGTTDGDGMNRVRKAILKNSLPIEDREAREIARLMLAVVTNPSAEAIKQGYDCHLAASRIGYERIGYALIDLLSDPDPVVRLGAATKLLELGRGRENALQTLEYLLTSDEPSAINPLIKALTASSLSCLDRVPEELHTRLEKLLHSNDRAQQLTAAAALRGDSPEAIRVLRRGLEAEDARLVILSAKGLIRDRIAVEHAVRKMISLIGTVSDLVDTGIIAELGHIKEMVEIIGPCFMRILKNANTASIVRTVTASAIGTIGYASAARDEFERALLASLKSGDWETVCASSTGLKDLGHVPPRVIRELVRLFKHSNTDARGMAVLILADLGPLSSAAIPDLFELVAVEEELDVLHSIGQAIEKIGLGDYLNDGAFVESTIDALIDQARREERVDRFLFRLAMFTLFGTRAVTALIRLAQENKISSVRIAISSLSMIGMTAPNEVIPAVVSDLLSHSVEHVRMVGTSILAEMGQTAESAVGHLARALDLGDSDIYTDVLRALRAMGPAAIKAAPSVIPLLAHDMEITAVRAEEALLAMGPDVRPILEQAKGHADGVVRRRAASLIKRIKATAGQSVGEFHWVQDDALIELFVAIGDILERDGPTSYSKLSKALGDLQSGGALDHDVDTHARTIAVKIKKLEQILSQKENRMIVLTDRRETKKGGLTADGKTFLAKAKLYLKAVRNTGS